MIDNQFWKGRRVFVTGHTGFKGGWLSLWLHYMGSEVTGYALEPPTSPSLFDVAGIQAILAESVYGDIRDLEKIEHAMQKAEPEIVIHMAAQPLVRDSYIDPVGTYNTNVMGTVHLFEAVRKTSTVKVVLNVTTDKCYENNEWMWGYRENEPMGGFDPYSNSKGCSELVSSAYRRSFFKEKGVALATARSGNVIGGGDWAKDRIVPDAIRSFIANEPLSIRNPEAVRPWQHVLDSISGYLMLSQKLFEEPEIFSDSWNFGPNDDDVKPVATLIDILAKGWGDGASWQLDSGTHPHEARFLKLDCSKAKILIGWKPIWKLERALIESVKWFKARSHDENMYKFTVEQIKQYQKSKIIDE